MELHLLSDPTFFTADLADRPSLPPAHVPPSVFFSGEDIKEIQVLAERMSYWQRGARALDKENVQLRRELQAVRGANPAPRFGELR